MEVLRAGCWDGIFRQMDVLRISGKDRAFGNLSAEGARDV